MIDRPLRDLVEGLAARTPSPGGGAAGGVAAAMGVALLLMVVRFSRGKKATAARDADLARAESALDALLQRAGPLAEADCTSFEPVAAAYGLPKDTPAQTAARDAAIRRGLQGAMVVPMQTLEVVREALRAAAPVFDCAGRTIVSDQAAGAALLQTAAEIACLNVRINARLLGDVAGGETLAAARARQEEIAALASAARTSAEVLL